MNDFKLPELGLENPQGVLDLAISSTRLGNVQSSMSKSDLIIPTVPIPLLEKAKNKFNELLEIQTRNSKGNLQDAISIDSLGEILTYVRIQVSDYELEGIKSQLSEREIRSLSFADVAEIIAFIQSGEQVFVNSFRPEKY